MKSFWRFKANAISTSSLEDIKIFLESNFNITEFWKDSTSNIYDDSEFNNSTTQTIYTYQCDLYLYRPTMSNKYTNIIELQWDSFSKVGLLNANIIENNYNNHDEVDCLPDVPVVTFTWNN